ncbi:MAG: glutamate synthase large subunit [Endomicrobiales bacterium]
MEQVFIGKGAGVKDPLSFERKLYVIRKAAENRLRLSGGKLSSRFYITNFSCRTFSYKGLLMPGQLDRYFPDLRDPLIQSALCVVHSRYSTNTFPTWDLAQPFRFLAHNGEINTLRGNINWMKAKESQLQSELFGEDIEKIKPVIVPGGSDSAMFDNVFELLLLAGRSLSHAIMMMIPAAWEKDALMDAEMREFYRYNACLMEPWDGPAAIAFTDGTRVGAVLDRNGLRPARYVVTKGGLAVLASEAGVLDIDPAETLCSGRLEPGRIFFINTEDGRIIQDGELKQTMARKQPYGDWVRENLFEFDAVPPLPVKAGGREKSRDILAELKTFGYTREDLKVILKPMAETGQEPVGSMGNDAPLAVLSQRPHLLYGYFKQLFAQVTNPPIDSIREELVMGLDSFMGSRANILEDRPEHCRKLYMKHPVLTDEDLAKIRSLDGWGFQTRTISLLFTAAGEKDFLEKLDAVCAEAEAAIKEGCNFLVLSDRGTDREHAALPALLAVGAVHQYLVKRSLRSHVGLILETAEPREVHHFALLFGFGAGFINPYLACDALRYLIGEKQLDMDFAQARKNYLKSVEKGILKILSKMGISTLRSYRGAQIFEALGLHDEVIEKCFTGTTSRIGGADLGVLAKETLMRHQEAYPDRVEGAPFLATGGLYQWKRDGEFHLWNPESIPALQEAARNNDPLRYREFSRLINDQSKNPTTLRSLLSFKAGTPVPLEEVEPASEIVRRFATGAMSFGSISKGAHETIAVAMNRLQGKSNTGEGGEDPARFVALANGDLKRSAIKQVASGRFGVTINYLTNADEIQIKIAQGAKPGEGGQLPGHKVSAIIARTRYTTRGVTLISPPPHHDIYSIEDLAQLIFDLKNANPRARISVKLVSEAGVGTVAAGVAKSHADMILISGGDGGTGASPLSSIKNAGLPWELGLSETHQTLVLNDLRGRVRLQTDGQLRTGRDVAIAALLGAEEFGFCTAVLIVLGCVMLRHCHLNNCSLGVATQDETLQCRFSGEPEHIVNYFTFVIDELRRIMADLGLRTIDEMVGRTDMLEVNTGILPWKAGRIDYSKILYRPRAPENVRTRCAVSQDHALGGVLDRELIELSRNALEAQLPVKIELPIRNNNRSAGAMLSGEVCRAHGERGLPDDTIHCTFTGVAGQSFGAFLAPGVTFELEGLANDYVGKGISGGKIVLYPDRKAAYAAEHNIIMGNTTFYGAIAGEAYIRGRAGERFCIRNSGLSAVVEGVGDHGCEYMTGGVAVILGKTGRNFAAGMSGGVAYVYDEEGDFRSKCNTSMVELEALDAGDAATLKRLLRNHHRCTGSPRAKVFLDDFAGSVRKFVKVIPTEYRNILEQSRKEQKQDAEQSDG